MNYITHTISLRNSCHYGRRVPPKAMGDILNHIPIAVDRSIRMAFQGASAPKGRRPLWLDAACDIRFVDHGGDDDTILYFEAPALGEAAEELYRQQELWPAKPAPEDTGFDLLGDVLAEIQRKNADSDKFDSPLLKGIESLRHGLNGIFQEMRITPYFSSTFEKVEPNLPPLRKVEPKETNLK